jgi:hypothetical protein
MNADPTPDVVDGLPLETATVRRRPRGLVIGLLAALAVLLVVAAVFVIWMATHVVQVGTDNTPRLTVGEVEHSSALDLPDDSVVLENTRTIEVFTAQVQLPDGELPDFAASGYSSVTEPSEGLAAELDSETGTEFYSGRNEDRVGSVALVDRDGVTVLFIDVRTVEYLGE